MRSIIPSSLSALSTQKMKKSVAYFLLKQEYKVQMSGLFKGRKTFCKSLVPVNNKGFLLEEVITFNEPAQFFTSLGHEVEAFSKTKCRTRIY